MRGHRVDVAMRRGTWNGRPSRELSESTSRWRTRDETDSACIATHVAVVPVLANRLSPDS